MRMKQLLFSLPVLLACSIQQLRADAVVAFNEVMYHPATNETAMEWVELKNHLAVDIDMSDWTLGGTIHYTFPSNTIIRARRHLVVAISPAALMAGTGLTGVLGPFTSRLDNDGGTLELRNNSGRLIDDVSYQVDNDWPVAADGSGASLAKRDPDTASGPARNWAASVQAGGTPGAANFSPAPAATTLAFSEVSSATNNPFFLEIQNTSGSPVALGGFTLIHDAVTNHSYAFPAGDLNPGALLAVTAADLGFTTAVGDKFYLTQNGTGRVVDALVVKNRSLARAPQITSPWAYPAAVTPGAANVVNFRSEIVINEIMHSHALLPGLSNQPPRSSPEEWLELHNRSASPVDLAGWQLGGGISYLFTPGQTIPAGGYLVIANDVPYLRSLYPGLTIVGDYGGKLSGSDHILLRDPNGNTADEVRYHTGQNWPVYSGGGGSSLELRDPTSDNTKAEAWAASDESSKGQWQTISYRMVANIPSGVGQPTTWQDFIVGLQGAGECLIDDLSVIESPTSAPVQVITNGGFENGLTGWRVLGTHNQSRVETDPDDAGNHVLRVVATGPQEHMHNHIERTLNAGRTIVAGREYQISYRARWTAGNNLLNTRLYFNRSPKTVALPMAALNGTPGAQNSRFVPNAGPTFSSFGHQRVIPAAGEAVTVTVVAEDPQGVNSCTVFFSVNSGAWANAAMTHQGGGVYTGTIPGQSAAAVVQFYVRAVDGLGAAAMYPARGTNSGALYKVNDGRANVALTSNVRLIFTPDNINFMHGNAQGSNQTNVMSNDLVPCTVIYNEERAFYDLGAHLRGSQRGRYSDVRTGYHINFHPDELFRDAHPVMLIDRSGAGDTASNRQEEVLLKHMINRVGGLPGTYGEICHLLAPRDAWNGAAQFFPRHEDVFVESAFGGGGQQFEMELIYYPTTANASGYKNPQPDAVIGTDMTDLGPDKEFYRYNFMLKGGREEDDYSRFIPFCKALSQSGTALDVQTKELMDVDQWMRAYAFVSLGGVGDMYSFGNNHNFFTYSRPSDGRFIYFPWDMDFSFSRGATETLVGDQNIAKVVNLPGNLRLLYGHMLDIIDVCYNPGYMANWVSHYQSISQGQNFAPRTAYIQTRGNFARTTINSQTGTNFVVSGTNNITTANNTIVLTGTAPASVRTVKINGVEYPITWTSVTAWRIVVTVSDPATVLNIATYDLKGRPLPTFNRTITVNYTGPVPNADNAVVINEIMYNPVVPDSAFVEIFNSSPDTSVNLSGWRINGIDYTFPSGTVITNRQHLLLVANPIGYYTAYTTNTPAPFAVFSGNLQNDGETLTLLKPGPTPGSEIVIDKVRYEGVPAWPLAANGGGASLQLIDAAQDNSRVANWSDGAGWRFASFTGTVQGGANPGTNFLIFLNTAGDAYLDDIQLVTGNQAGVGANILLNGDFESPLAPAWALLGNHSNSVVSTDDRHSGNASLHIIAPAAGGGSATLRQYIPAFASNTLCTLSFWFRPTSTASNITFRTNPGSLLVPVFNLRPIFSTPGALNTVVATLPPFPALWLNEVQSENTSGLADNQGEREPWIELYNAGNTAIDLSGYTLANTYANLSQWSFPPGANLQPGEFKVVIADGEPGETTAGEWHTGFRLNAGHGSVALGWSPGGALQVLDYLNYTNLPPDRSYGAFPDGQPFDRQEFFRVTAGATNDNVAPPIVVYINEWMAANSGFLLNTNNGNRFDDWFELHNPGNTPANLAGYFLTDNLANKNQFEIPAGYVIPAHGFLLVWADNRPNLNTNTDSALHVNFRLEQNGDAIGLFASDGAAIDTADFRTEPQFNDRSEGRFPDGPNATYFLLNPTPLAPNTTWANRYPVLAAIPDATVGLNQLLIFSAIATDPDLPTQSLTFSLDAGAPTNATINPSNGLFGWVPNTAQTPGTNFITVRVTDSGMPQLSAARTFRAFATSDIRVSGIVRNGNGEVSITFGTIAGKIYRLEYKNDLNDEIWTILPQPPTTAASGTLTLSDPIGANPQRFYRVRQLD